MKLRMFFVASLALATLLSSIRTSQAQFPFDIDEFLIPGVTSPEEITSYADSKGGESTLFPPPPGLKTRWRPHVNNPDPNAWFTDENSKIGRCTTSGVITEFDTNGFPLDITAGPDGNFYFTDSGNTAIGKIKPDGTVTEIPIPSLGEQEFPNPVGITSGPDGALWFTDSNTDYIIRMTPGGSFTKFDVLSNNPGLNTGITVGPDGNIWFTERNANKIGRLTTSGTVTEFAVPTANSGLIDITRGLDGALWFTEINANKIGRVTTAGAFQEFDIPTANSRPAGITAGPDGNIYFCESNANKIGQLITSAAKAITARAVGDITEIDIPTKNSLPEGITAGTDGKIYFCELNGGKIGRLSIKTAKADLEVTKTASSNSVQVNSNVTYTIKVTNKGPDSSSSITVTDTLPDGLTFVSSNPTPNSTTTTTQTFIVNSLAANASTTITVTAKATKTGSLKNTVAVSSQTSDPVSSNDNASATITVNPPGPDVSVTKTASAATVNQGSPVTYTLKVSNAGPGTATGVNVTDNLPAGMSFVSSTPAPSSQSGQSINYTIGSLASGASSTISIVARANSSGDLTNTATASTISNDPDPQNNTDTVTTTVRPVADLAVTKTASAQSIDLGGTVDFHIVVTNNGPASATGVQVTDNLPAGLTFVSSNPAATSRNGNSLEYALGTLAKNAKSEIVITVRPTAAGKITNSATASSGVADTVSSNNSDSAEVTVNPVADLKLTKTASADSVDQGGAITYTLKATNLGPSTATGVKVIDTLPAGVTFISSTPAPTSQDGSKLTYNIGTLANGAQSTITLRVRAVSAGTVRNSATITGNEKDSSGGNNTGSVSVDVDAVADVGVTKTTDVSTVVDGSNVTYTIKVTNHGPSAATNVEVTDSMDFNMSFVSSSPAPTSRDDQFGEVTYKLGTMASGATATITFTVKIDDSGSEFLESENHIFVLADQDDSNSANDEADVTIKVQPAADLVLTKRASVRTTTVGQTVDYTLVFTNRGPDGTDGPITVTDSLPAGMAFLSSSPAPTSRDGNTLRYRFNQAMFEGESQVIVIHARAIAPASTVNSATVSNRAFDPVVGNNTAAAPVDVKSVADLSITKSASATSVAAGGKITYTITVHNNGPSRADNAKMIDTLPASLSFSSATPAPAQRNGNRITFNLGSINSGATKQIILVAVTSTLGTVMNQADVTSDALDNKPENNHASTSSTVRTPRVTLSITQTVSPPTVPVGQNFQYHIVVSNNGPDAATNLVLTDTLPGGVSFVSSVPPPLSVQGNIVTYSLGDFAPGQSATINITVKSLVSGTFTNTASAKSNQTAPNPVTAVSNAVVTLTPSGPTNVTPQIGISFAAGGPVLISPYLPGLFGGPPRFAQTITLKNIGTTPIKGPISLVFDNLTNGVKLIDATGKITRFPPNGSPYFDVNVGRDNVFSPGESTTFQLKFESTVGPVFSFTPRVIAGVGPR